MDLTLFRGCGTALITPFHNGEVDFPALGRLIDRQTEGGADALIVCGTTGEASCLTADEKDSVLDYTLTRVNGRLPVIMGTGTNCTAVSVRRSVRAQEMGASALLVITPYYNKCTQEGLLAHFTAVADAVSVPVILYNVPPRTGVNLLPETAARLGEHPSIRGIKEASGDIAQAAELARLCGDSLALYSGCDDQVLPMLSLGGQGVISVASNIVPGAMHDLVFSWFAGDAARSRALQLSLLPLIRQLFAEVNPIPVKAALEMLGICSAEARLPLTPLSSGKRHALQAALDSLPGICGS